MTSQLGRRIRISVHGEVVCDWLPFGDEDRSPNSLDCAFTVLQHAKPEPLTCELTIYNRSEAARAKMTAIQTRARELGWKATEALQSGSITVEPGGEAAAAAALAVSAGLVKIEVGYQFDSALISRTQILAMNGIKHSYNGQDWVTTIRSQDGRLPWQNAFVSQPVAPGVSLRDVNRVLEASQQFLEGTLAEKAFTEQYPELLVHKSLPGAVNGMVLHGNTRDQNADILDTLGIEAFYLNGELIYTPKGAATFPDAVRLSRANNLLTAVPDDFGRYTATTLLDHKISPGRQVMLIDDDDVTPIGGGTGIFRVDQVTHSGDNFGGSFTSVAVLRPSGIDGASNL